MMLRPILLSLTIASVAFALPSPRARTSFDRGEKALAADKLEEAEAAYREALQASPDFAEAINGLGSVYFKQGKRTEAIGQFRAAIQADPELALAYFNLGYAARKVGDFVTAAQAYERYTKLRPEDADGFYGLGESYRQLNDAEKAIAAYEEYVRREKRASEQKWVDRARQTITELNAQLAAARARPAPAQPVVAEVAPAPAESASVSAIGARRSDQAQAADPVKVKLDEGDRLMQERKFRDASFAYQDAINANPNSVEANFKLGNTYAVLGYYSQAIERWTRVTQLTSDPGVKRSAEQNIAKAQSKLAATAPASAQPTAAAPAPAPTAAAPASVPAAAPAPTAAAPQTQEVRPAASAPAVNNTPRGQARSFYEQGVKQISARDYAGALQSLSQALQLEPNLTVGYVARGSALIGLRRFNEAALDYDYAHRLDPSLSSPLYGLAEAYRVMGRSADAKRFYELYAQSTAPDVRPELQAQAREKASLLR